MQSSYSNNYGLNNSYDYYEYVFDSSQSINGDVNNPTFLIGGKKPITNLAAIKILEVQIPYSYYACTGDQMKFGFTNAGGTVETFIPAGNYTITTLIAAFQNALNAASTATGSPQVFTVTYVPLTGKLVAQAVAGTFTLTFTGTGIEPLLGFNVGSYASPLLAPFFISAPNVAVVTGPSYLYVNSNTVGTLVNLYLPGNNAVGGNAGPQIAKVPVNANPGGTIYWQDPDPQKWFDVENLTSLQKIDFYLTLGTNVKEVLELNGVPFSIKVGMLLTNMDTSNVGSGLDESRISKRIRPI
jgi:hypothetical protein